MDGRLGIEINRGALKRILLGLVAMAGISAGPEKDPVVRAGGEHGKTLPRSLHRAVLRLLRPAEAATRRLVIALARGIVVALPVRRPRKPAPKSAVVRNGIGGILLSPGVSRKRSGAPRPLVLFDPPLRPFRLRRATVPAHLAPRICAPGVSERRKLPPPLSPDDPLDATRLGLRLAALAGALDDLPRHALRFARWQARLARAAEGGRHGDHADMRAQAGRRIEESGKKARWRWPLRLGRPPGAGPRKGRRHEVHDVLEHAHELAWWALEQKRLDTS